MIKDSLIDVSLLNNEEVLYNICETVDLVYLPQQSWMLWTERKSVPKEPGIYILSNDGEIVYIGETSNIYDRLTHHENGNGSALKEKIQDYTSLNPIDYLNNCMLKVLPIKFGRLEIEKHLIRKYNPIFNNYKLRKRYNK